MQVSVPGDSHLSPDQANEVFIALHSNLYRAFDSTVEEEIYRSLATAVAGELLDELYGDLQRSLTDQEQGGARAEVEALRHTEVLLEGKGQTQDSFMIHASWQVDAAVHHFGHFHRRTTAYKARYTLTLGPEGWKIHDFVPLAQERLATSTNDPSLPASDEEGGG